MTNVEPKTVPRPAGGSSKIRVDFDAFLAKLPAKDRANLQKRLAVADETAGCVTGVWRRLASTLLTLAPHAAKMSGRDAVQYYVADGKYRMQVFALEDLRDGSITVYCPDVLNEALTGKILAPPHDAASGRYGIVGSSHVLTINVLDRSAIDPAAYFKDMIGWNRRAMRITMPAAASARQVDATEWICDAAAAHQFGRSATTSATSATSAISAGK